MGRVDAPVFGDRETSLIFLARSFKEAEKVEELLSDQGIDYTVELERYVAGVMFAFERSGIGFRVLAGQANLCRNLLRRILRAGVVDEPPAR